MSSDQTASLIYLMLLGTVIGGYYFVSHRHNLSQLVKQMMTWALIFIGVIVGYGLWNDLQRTVIPRQSVLGEAGQISVPQSADGHYYLTLNINEVPVQFVVDTGATSLVLTKRDAARVGVEPDELAYIGVANTANGQVRTAAVWLDQIELGGIKDYSIAAQVNGGEMNGSLLGMDYLNRFSSVEFGQGRMLLTR